MMKRFTLSSLLALFLLALGGAAFAQNTTITATITDTDGTIWANGNYTITFVPNPRYPNISQYTWSGGNLINNSLFKGLMDSTGTFTVTIPDSTTIFPSGSQWKIQVCPNATAGCQSQTLQTSGATQNFTSQLSAVAAGPRFPATPQAYGYSDIEIDPIPLPGGYYFNVNLLAYRFWNGTQWVTAGQGGGGGGSSPNPVINFVAATSVSFPYSTYAFTTPGFFVDCYDQNNIHFNPSGWQVVAVGAGQYSVNITLSNGIPLTGYCTANDNGGGGGGGGAYCTLTGCTMTGPLNSPNIEGTYFADQCPGADIGAKINACIANIPANSVGFKAGTIVLPNTTLEPTLSTWNTPVVVGPGTSLVGQGTNASMFNCTTGTNSACLTYDSSAGCPVASCPGNPTTPQFAHTTLGQNTVLRDFQITGTGASGQDILYTKDAQGLVVRNANFDNAGAGGACIHMHDLWWWTERNEFDNVSSLYGCNIGWRFTASPTSPYLPTASFGYNRFIDIGAQPGSSDTAFSWENGVFMYNTTFRATVNKGGTGATVFLMSGNAEFYLNELHFTGEDNGPGGYLFNLTNAANIFTFQGDFNWGPETTANNVAAGATVEHFLDSGGFKPSFMPNVVNEGIQALNASPLGSGFDLNTGPGCGTFEGQNPVNGPNITVPVGGNLLYQLGMFCYGTSVPAGYRTQVFVQASYNVGLNKVWYRNQAGGTWYPWTPMILQNSMPLTGQTGALPGASIAAGVCTSLTATVPQLQLGATVSATPNSTTQLNVGLHWDTAYISSLSSQPTAFTNSSLGTATNLLVVTQPNGTVRTAFTSDYGNLIGVCTSGCGTTGTAQITIDQTANVAFDGPTVANDYFVNSTTAAGKGHDIGATIPVPSPSQILGQVLSTNASAGTYAAALQSSVPGSGTVTVPVCNLTASPITPSSTPTFSVRVIQ